MCDKKIKTKKDDSDLHLARWTWATGIWFCIVFLLAAYNLGFSSNTVQLNELGDFVAGAMSPLAILWLVMVYRQQRKEMRDQVVQTKEIAEETKKQVAIMDKQFKKQYEPFFVCHAVGVGISMNDSNGESVQATLTIENFGGVAIEPHGKVRGQDDQDSFFDVSINKQDDNPATHAGDRRNPSIIKKNQKIDISFFFSFKTDEEKLRLCLFEFSFSDLIGRRFILEGHYRYGDGLSTAGIMYGKGTQAIKKENVFPHPAKIVSQ